MRCAERTRVSWAISNSSSMAAACCITAQSLDEPMIKPTMGEPCPLCVASVMLNSTMLGHQPSSGLAILGRRFFQDIGWQAGGRRGFVPHLGFKLVAHELLVERGRADADRIARSRPEARREIGRAPV